ncbi:MAG: flagellar hook assembly protein FlgD [Alphaproteobacteria bacterium]|nr:flagellar hook assembly protein FlgD [Alphaproteobacteria bacterium]
MTDISALTNTVQVGAATTNSSSQTLSADMNTFLTLLTTQLKYQDPMDPMDTAEFTNQLVQYSSVEQAIQTNSKLDNLLTLTISNLGAQAVSYIGKTAQVLGDVMPLEGGKAKATYTLSKDALSTTISVKDMSGKVVYTENGNITAGTHEFTWDGKDSNGNQLEDGAYQIVVSPKVANGETAVGVTTTIFGKVTGVANDESDVYIGLGDAVTAKLGDILTMRDDNYFDKVDAGSSDAGDASNSQDGVVDAEDTNTQTV